jgi:O-acetyl-ADP-ribose deacetylase (regulator of RNase III)
MSTITFKKGDILDSKMKFLINTVNCVGIMGKGIALSFKGKYPEMFQDYKVRCSQKQISLGKPYCYYDKSGKTIVNFPTKYHWRNNSKILDIEKGLLYLVEHYEEWGITSIAFPPLGCTNGKLDWKQVKPLLIKYASKMNIPVEIYEPY